MVVVMVMMIICSGYEDDACFVDGDNPYRGNGYSDGDVECRIMMMVAMKIIVVG